MCARGRTAPLRLLAALLAAAAIGTGSAGAAAHGHGGGFHGSFHGGFHGSLHGGRHGGFHAGSHGAAGFHAFHPHGGFQRRARIGGPGILHAGGGWPGAHHGGFRSGRRGLPGTGGDRWRGWSGNRWATAGAWGFAPGFAVSGGWWGPGWLGLDLFLPILPWYYESFSWDGIPYYYGDGSYYVWDGDAGEYQQVTPPPDLGESAPPAPPGEPGAPSASFELYAYPKAGQSEAQQARDKADCRKWAQGQVAHRNGHASTGQTSRASSGQTTTSSPAGPAPDEAPPSEQAPFPAANLPGASGPGASVPGASGPGASAPGASAPGASAPGAAPPDAAGLQEDYLRAEAACLEAHGYSVD